jgi:ribosomal protein L32
MMDIAARQYDAWITREPDYPDAPTLPRCEQCGSWLRVKADVIESHVTDVPCDGRVHRIHCVYTDQDEAILNIIGWDRLGDSYWDEFPPECGSDSEHDPHSYPIGGHTVLHRKCKKCGYTNAEVVV